MLGIQIKRVKIGKDYLVLVDSKREKYVRNTFFSRTKTKKKKKKMLIEVESLTSHWKWPLPPVIYLSDNPTSTKEEGIEKKPRKNLHRDHVDV